MYKCIFSVCKKSMANNCRFFEHKFGNQDKYLYSLLLFKRRADYITLSLENKASQQNAFIPYITRSIIVYSIYRNWVRT